MRYMGGFKEIKVNMVDAIDAHVKTMVDILDALLEKSIGTLYKGKENKRAEYSVKLDDLRIEKKGGMVVRFDNGPKIIVTFAPPPD
jgi:hypothetical protein